MANIKYFTKESKGKKETTAIYIRFTHGRGIDIKCSTSLIINPKYWNNSKGYVKQIAEFNDKVNLQNDLNDLKTHILNAFNNSYSKGGVINSNWLRDTIKEKFNQEKTNDLNYFIDFAEYYKTTLNSKVLHNGKTGVSKNTIKRYTSLINKFRQFETYKKRHYLFTDIDLKFYRDFKYFLTNIDKLNLNTTGRYINYVKTLCREAKNYGIKINSDIDKKEFRATKENVTFITLNETEIDKIYNHTFKQPYLENAKQWLIISVWTGARVSDFLNFTKENVTNGFLEYTAKKTEQKIIIGLHPQVKEILNINKGEFPRKISPQKYNDYIKTVCKEVKINELIKGTKTEKIKKNTWRKQKGKFPKHELVTSHIGRRSFATNHYGKLPTPVLMAITGHKTEKMFLNYIGKTSMDNAEVLNEFWRNQEIKKNKEKPDLKVIKTGTN